MEKIGANFERKPGDTRGCSCCGFWLMGMMALPLLATILLVIAL